MGLAAQIVVFMASVWRTRRFSQTAWLCAIMAAARLMVPSGQACWATMRRAASSAPGPAKRLSVIGGMGTMLSPSASHFTGTPFQVVAAHARPSALQERVEAWEKHGAKICSTVEDTLKEDSDMVIVCVGKNGDDLPLIAKTAEHWAGTNKAIIHFSTVSPRFVEAARSYCDSKGVRYGNYPLTGGPVGAQQATMLILASGSRSLYDEFEPVLQSIGKPKFFGKEVSRGAVVKLQVQMMAFGGLLGVCSSAATGAASVGKEVEQSTELSELMDFLNGGAGSTRQWDAALARGVRNGDWQEGFQVDHASIDAVYAADAANSFGLSQVTQGMLSMTAASLAFLVKQADGGRMATHSIAKELKNRHELDEFIRPLWPSLGDYKQSSAAVLDLLPPRLRGRVCLNVTEDSFREAV